MRYVVIHIAGSTVLSFRDNDSLVRESEAARVVLYNIMPTSKVAKPNHLHDEYPGLKRQEVTGLFNTGPRQPIIPYKNKKMRARLFEV